MISAIFGTFSLLLLWRESHFRSQLYQAQVIAKKQIETSRRDADECMRLLRAAGTELRDQGLSLLALADSSGNQDTGEWTAVAVQLLAMADDLQDHAPSSPERRILTKEYIEMGLLVQHCIDAVAANLRPTQRLWRISPRLDELRLLGDRRAVTQVILRLLSNAARTTRHLDWIEIDGKNDSGRVVLSVTDEGNGGIAPFGRNHPEGRALGFGLAVTRSLVAAHGGNLSIEAIPGIGAKVEVALPQ